MIHYCVKAISIFFWKLYAYIQYFEVLQNDDFLLLYNCYFKVSQSYIITLVFGWVYPLHDSNWSFFRDFMFLVLGGVPTSSSTLKLVISPSISKSSMTTILLPFVHKLFSYLQTYNLSKTQVHIYLIILLTLIQAVIVTCLLISIF